MLEKIQVREVPSEQTIRNTIRLLRRARNYITADLAEINEQLEILERLSE